MAPTESHSSRAIYEHLNVNISISSCKMHQNARNSDNDQRYDMFCILSTYLCKENTGCSVLLKSKYLLCIVQVMWNLICFTSTWSKLCTEIQYLRLVRIGTLCNYQFINCFSIGSFSFESEKISHWNVINCYKHERTFHLFVIKFQEFMTANRTNGTLEIATIHLQLSLLVFLFMILR